VLAFYVKDVKKNVFFILLYQKLFTKLEKNYGPYKKSSIIALGWSINF